MKYRLWAPLLLSMLATGNTYANECGRVTIADMTWSSATLIAHIDQFILKHGYGCDAELIASDSVPAGTSMVERGQPDIAPEFWLNGMKAAIEKGVQEKRLRKAGKSLIDGGEEGFWVPSYLVKKYPEMKTIEGVRQHAKLFENPEDPDHSAFYTCPAGWNCQISANNLFKALKLDKAGFTIVDPGSSAGLSGAIAKANERHEAWFGYYWAPTAVLGKYDMVKVDFGSGVDKDEFIHCTTQDECENPKPTMYPPSPVYTLTTEKFATKSPEVYTYLSKRGFTNARMNKLLAWMEDNQADGEDTMYYFLENYPQVWKQWLPQDIAQKVADAI
jgi:glycine betaine/proline transport system substrate-binding protein